MVAGEIEIRLMANIARLQADMDRANRVVGDATSRIAKAAETAKEALAGIGAGIGLAQIIQMSDAYAKFTAQLRLATTSAREYGAASADVKRIANTAQQELGATGMLYARIANGTRELGTAQKKVADITEVVNLGLKISGATAAESASAQLQLSQAFASGTLRGEEFNAVNEAAPRLMKALADGIGVPVGALKQMASDGKITSQVMADVLPRALESMRSEASEVQTISGAFTVLKNNLMEFVGIQSQANGTVALLTGGIGFLANNLALLMGVMSTLTAVKVGTWAASWIQSTYATAAANRALVASNLEAANSHVAAAAAASALTTARVAELRAAVLAAEGEVALAITTNGLIPAQARAALAAEAHAAALVAQTTALGAASVAGGVLRGALAFLGGPIGAIITLLGIGATAWSIWGEKGSKAEKQVVETLADEIDGYLENLNRQIDKLKERNELAGKGMTSGAEPALEGDKKRASIMAEINRIGKQTDLDISTKTALMSVWGGKLNQLTIETEAFAAAQQKNKDLIFSEKEAEWLGKNGSAAQKMAYDLAALRKEFGRVTPEMEAFVKAKYADKGAATTVKQEETAYTALVTAIGEKIAAGKLEMNGYATLTDAQKLAIKLDEAIISGKNKLTPKHIEEARVMIATVAAQDEVVASQKRAAAGAAEWEKILKAQQDLEFKAIEDAIKEVERNEELVLTFGMKKSAIEALGLARLEEQYAQRNANALTVVEIDNLEKLIAAKRRNAGAVAKFEGLEAAKKASDDLDKFLDPAKAQTFGEALKGAFGAASDSLGRLSSALQAYGIQQAEIDKARKNATIKYAGDSKGLAAATEQLSKRETQARVSAYGDMAGAAKGFFKENSKGYKVMETAEKAFRAYELAMAVESMVKKIFFKEGEVAANLALNATKTTGEAASTAVSTGLAATEASAWGVTAVVKALASLPFPANLAAGAATLAAVVAIGAKLIGGLGGSSGVDVSKERQAATGTGSVLGNSSAKSDSIARSLSLAAENSNIELQHTAGMLSALRNIESSLGGLASLLVRGSGVTGTMASASEGGASKFASSTAGVLAIGGPLSLLLDKITGGWVSKTLGKVANSIFGGNTTSLDTGLTMQRASLGAVLNGGVSASQYNDTKTDGGWFSSDKYRTQTTALGAEANAQFSKVIANMADGVKEAGKLLGLGGEAFSQQLNGFVVDLGKISLKGLTGEQIQEQLEAAFSKLGDDMARSAVGGLDQFQKVGEGYLETLTRIGTNYANLDSILAASGSTFGAVGLGSIAARERLIDLAGGIDDLASTSSSFADAFLTEAQRLAPVQKYVTEQLAAMGLAGIDTRDKFRDTVLGLASSGALATEAGAKQYAGLLALADAFAKTHAATEDLTLSEQAVADQRKDLQSQLNELTMTADQLHAIERATIAASNLALYDQVYLQKKLADSTAAASEALKGTVERLTAARASSLAYRDSLLMGSLSTLTPMQKAAEAQRQYAAALEKAKAKPDDSAAQSAVQTAATAFLTASQVINANSASQIANVAQVQADMTVLANLAGAQLTDAQLQMAALDKQVAGLVTLNETASGIEQAIVNLGAAGGTSAGQQGVAVDFGGYGTPSVAPLVDEIKALRVSNESLIKEVQGLRAEQFVQTGDLIDSNVKATAAAAETVVAGAAAAAAASSYRSQLMSEARPV
ncbi:MAG: tape measure protein [Massilia sp.]